MGSMGSEMEMENEPGSTDNELRLSPGDYPFIQDWQDGANYRMTVEVTQTAPGLFRVNVATPEGAPEGEGPAPEAEAGYSEPTNSGSYPNPAVARLLGRA